jgi:hypothetical protein
MEAEGMTTLIDIALLGLVVFLVYRGWTAHRRKRAEFEKRNPSPQTYRRKPKPPES